MSNMMRGRTASCGCCRSKPAPQGAERAGERREAERMIAEWEEEIASTRQANNLSDPGR